MGFVLPFGIIALYFIELVGNKRALCPQLSTPKEVTDDDLKRIPRAVIIAAAAAAGGDIPSQHQGHASGRKPSKTVSASLREFTKTVLTGEEEAGITKEGLAEGFCAEEKRVGTELAVEWLQTVVRDARGDANHLRFLYASYKLGECGLHAQSLIQIYSPRTAYIYIY
jgi:hypothetical protein